jgi:hypothetical protein
MRSDPIDPNSAMIDSRDVIARIGWHEIDEEDINEEDAEELAALQKLVKDVEEISGEECRYGVSIISDGYFTDYIRERFVDTRDSDHPVNLNEWPFSHIDWDAAADEEKRGYTEVTFDGRSFWVEDE